jgi:hypothetical protein
MTGYLSIHNFQYEFEFEPQRKGRPTSSSKKHSSTAELFQSNNNVRSSVFDSNLWMPHLDLLKENIDVQSLKKMDTLQFFKSYFISSGNDVKKLNCYDSCKLSGKAKDYVIAMNGPVNQVEFCPLPSSQNLQYLCISSASDGLCKILFSKILYSLFLDHKVSSKGDSRQHILQFWEISSDL